MANSKQAKKRGKQSEVRRQRNQSVRTKLRTFIKNVRKAIALRDKSAAQLAYNEAVPFLDKCASSNLIHKNKAARHKSRLNEQVNKI